VSTGHSTQKTAPGKVDVNLVGYSIEFRWKSLDSGLYKQDVWQSTLGEFAIDSFRDFLQRSAVGVDTNKEFVRLAARRVVDEEAVSRPDINDDSPLASFERSNQFLKCSPINLSKGFTAD
jgi:hypothetical protein